MSSFEGRLKVIYASRAARRRAARGPLVILLVCACLIGGCSKGHGGAIESQQSNFQQLSPRDLATAAVRPPYYGRPSLPDDRYTYLVLMGGTIVATEKHWWEWGTLDKTWVLAHHEACLYAYQSDSDYENVYYNEPGGQQRLKMAHEWNPIEHQYEDRKAIRQLPNGDIHYEDGAGRGGVERNACAIVKSEADAPPCYKRYLKVLEEDIPRSDVDNSRTLKEFASTLRTGFREGRLQLVTIDKEKTSLGWYNPLLGIFIAFAHEVGTSSIVQWDICLECKMDELKELKSITDPEGHEHKLEWAKPL